MSAQRLSIRTRLLALGLLPLVALLLIGATSMRSVLAERAETAQLVRLVGLSTGLTDLVHALQVERGTTSGFVTSRGASMGTELTAARAATDTARSALTDYVGREESLPQDVRAGAQTALESTATAVGQRDSVDRFERPVAQYLAGYTSAVDALLTGMASVTYATGDADMTRDLGAMAALAWAKENTGLERAQLTAAFAVDRFAAGQAARITGLSNQRAAYLSMYEFLGGPDAAAQTTTLQESPSGRQVAQIETAALAKSGDFTMAPSAWFATASAYIDQMRDLEHHQQEHVGQQAQQLADDASRTVWLVALALALVAAATAALLWWTVRSILRGLRRIEVVLTGLREGRLDERFVVEGRDEINVMGGALNTAMDSMEDALRTMRGAAHELSTSARALGGVAVDLQSHAADSASRADEASSSAGEVSRDVDELATAGEELRAAIDEIARSAHAAQQIVDTAVASAQEAADTIAELEQSSGRIDEVLKSVAAISEQTNLLALNATIEAARAGEAGKGFAVVAGEVKDLAQETTAATEDIGRRVERLREDTRAASSRIEAVGSTVAQMSGVQAAIAAAVEEQTATTASIGQHVGLAATGTRTIAGRVQGVADLARRTDESAASTRTSAESLARLSTELSTVIDRFRVRA